MWDCVCDEAYSTDMDDSFLFFSRFCDFTIIPRLFSKPCSAAFSSFDGHCMSKLKEKKN